MDGLDLLKQSWQNDQGFPKIKKEQIRSMLYKKSSSIVKWIFIISLIELFIGVYLNLFLYLKEDRQHDNVLDIFNNVIDVLSYIVIIYFIYAFFRSYRKIKNTNNTKELLTDILNTRKTVGYYMQFNIYLIIYAIGFSSLNLTLEEDVMNRSIGHNILFFTLLTVIMFVVGWITIKIVKLYFRAIYVRLVKKLDKNYKDLVELDEEENLAKQ